MDSFFNLKLSNAVRLQSNLTPYAPVIKLILTYSKSFYAKLIAGKS